jgi:hypothetical protein
MPATSGNYSFNSIKGELIIRKAYELIGMPLSMVTAEQYNSALNIINFILSDWTNSNVNLWTLKLNPVFLTPGQASYPLPSNITKVFQVFLRNNVRQNFGGTPSNDGYGGIAAYAFDGNPATRCIQNAQNGNISYDYGLGVTKQISIIGIQSYVSNRPYSLVLEASQDTINWFTVDTFTPLFPYQANVVKWWDIQFPINARSYRIRETGGYTLDLEEIYFCNNTIDTAITSVSEDTYESFSNKNLISRPTVYFYDKKLSPKLYLYPSPSKTFQVLRYSFIRSMCDAGNFFNTPEIPAKMYPALVAGLAWRLAVKYKPEVADSFKMQYDQEFSEASSMDAEHVDITISYDLSKYDVR